MPKSKVSPGSTLDLDWHVAVNQIPVAFSIISPAFTYEYVNQAFSDLVGIKTNKVVGMSVDALFDAESAKRVKSMLKKTWRGEHSQAEIYFPNHPNGPRWIIIDLHPRQNGEGKTTGIYSICKDNSDSHHRQEELERAEKRLQLALEATGLAMFDVYPKENKIFWDERMHAQFELDPASKVDRNDHFFSKLHAEDREEVAANYQKNLDSNSTSKTFQDHYRIHLNNGSIRYNSILGYIFRDKAGNVERIIGTAQDVTEKRLAQLEVDRSRDQLSMIVNNAKDFIVLLSWDEEDELIISGANRALIEFQTAYGISLTEEEMCGMKMRDYLMNLIRVPADKVEERVAYINAARESKTTVVYLEQSVAQDGTEQGLESSAIPILKDGVCTHMLWISHDVSTILNAEKELRNSEEKYRHLVERIPSVACTRTATGKILFLSPNVELVLGFEPEELSGKRSSSWFTYVHPDDLGKVQLSSKKLFQKSVEFDLQYRVRHKKGHWIWVHDRANTFDVLGDEPCMYAVFSDITKQKQAEQQLRQSEERLTLILDSTSDQIVLLELRQGEFIFISANKQTRDFLKSNGIEEQDFLNRELKDYVRTQLGFTKEQSIALEQKYQLVVTSKKVLVIENEVNIEEASTESYFETTLNPIIDDSGECTQVLITARDISAQRLSTLRLEKAFSEIAHFKQKLELENVYLQEEILLQNDFQNMIYGSTELRNVLNKVEQVAPLDVTVLLTGETGTGKELLARAIHDLSPRSKRPMIKINCGAIPKDLVESELFGHEKGAFTGAIEKKLGKFELANGSTIFLDEVGELPLAAQVKLLRVLQEGEFERIGGTKTIHVDVRLVAATNRNLKEAIKEGVFREDMYYRINVFPIHIPALRERTDDIPPLLDFFISKYSTKHAKKITFISQEELDSLQNYPWPGNVRELENMIERGVITSVDGALSFAELRLYSQKTASSKKAAVLTSYRLADVERAHIMKVVRECDWKLGGAKGAASILGLKPSTLRDRMRKLDIRRPQEN